MDDMELISRHIARQIMMAGSEGGQLPDRIAFMLLDKSGSERMGGGFCEEALAGNIRDSIRDWLRERVSAL